MCCYRCGSVMRNVLDDNGYAIRGIKECRGCRHLPSDDSAHWVRLVPVPAIMELPMALAPACDACPAYAELDDIKDGKGQALRWLKLCTHTWDAMHASKLRNRDLNAAMNIWQVLHALVHSQPRPEHLRKRYRLRGRVQAVAPA